MAGQGWGNPATEEYLVFPSKPNPAKGLPFPSLNEQDLTRRYQCPSTISGGVPS